MQQDADKFSDEYIKANCPHCDRSHPAFKFYLQETPNFHIVADENSIVEGHTLLLPKAHLSCIGEYPDEIWSEFIKNYKQIKQFIASEYGPVASFEHGVLGQTVYHSHVHFMPFTGGPEEIVPEGAGPLQKIDSLEQLKDIYKKDGGYLFFSLGDDMWVVDKALAAPRFFRDRFAKAVGRPERGNWKAMLDSPIKKDSDKEARNFVQNWKTHL